MWVNCAKRKARDIFCVAVIDTASTLRNMISVLETLETKTGVEEVFQTVSHCRDDMALVPIA